MTVTMDVDIVSGNANVGKSVKDYMNNNAKIFVNSKWTVVNGKNDTVNGRRNA